MPDPQVIFLNGTSSSGKTSLARALQQRLDAPYIFFAEDAFFDGMPQQGWSSPDSFTYGMRLYTGFARSARTMVECENRIIVDTAAWVPGCLERFVDALHDLRVFAVGVHCDLAVLEERERQRGNRSVGQARRQFDQVHLNALYDLEIDTSAADADACAQRVVEAMAHPLAPHAFARMKAQFASKTQ